MPDHRPTSDELASLPAVLDLRTAAAILGIGRTTAYRLARAGAFPCPVIRIGSSYRIPTAGLLRLLDATPSERRTRVAA